ncbi:uncharacterized protein TNCV_1220501 [Trichonephila clavipes]|nr:uncharacterized protein TNCV_1220501 [Trichonephila clavipes]
MFSLIDRVTAEIRERFQQLQNLAQKHGFFLRPEVILIMDEVNLHPALQGINKESRLERVHLQAFVAATDPGFKKELIRDAANFRSAPGGESPLYATAWTIVPLGFIQSLFDSVPKRVTAVIANNGCYTIY